MLPHGSSYDEIRATFRRQITERTNIGVDVFDRWAATDPGRVSRTLAHCWRKARG